MKRNLRYIEVLLVAPWSVSLSATNGFPLAQACMDFRSLSIRPATRRCSTSSPTRRGKPNRCGRGCGRWSRCGRRYELSQTRQTLGRRQTPVLREQGIQAPSPAPDLIPAEHQPRTYIGIGTTNGGASISITARIGFSSGEADSGPLLTTCWRGDAPSFFATARNPDQQTDHGESNQKVDDPALVVKSSRHETSINVRCQHAKHKNSQPVLSDRKWDR